MQEKLFLALLEASSAHAERSRLMFQKFDLTEGQPKILYILKRGDGFVQKELAVICGIKQSTLTVLLEKLEKKKYIRKEVSHVSGGKRAFRIYLTDEGKQMAENIENIVEELETESFKGLDNKERKMLLKLLGKVSKNLLK